MTTARRRAFRRYQRRVYDEKRDAGICVAHACQNNSNGHAYCRECRKVIAAKEQARRDARRALRPYTHADYLRDLEPCAHERRRGDCTVCCAPAVELVAESVLRMSRIVPRPMLHVQP